MNGELLNRFCKLACAVLVAGAMVAVAQAPALSPLKPGAKAPDFSLSDAGGKMFDSKSAAGKRLFVVFFTGVGQRQLLTDLAAIEEKNRDGKFAFVAIHYAPDNVKPADVEKQLTSAIPREEPKYPILLEGLAIAQAFGVENTNAAFLIDEKNVIRGSATLPAIAPPARAPQAITLPGLLEQKFAVWSGAPPAKLGWRNDLAQSWEYAIEGIREANGNLRPRGMAPKPLAAPLAARELLSFAPDREINIVVVNDPDAEPKQIEMTSALVRAAIAEWQPVLPALTFNIVTDRSKADLVLVYRSVVPDPRDENGIKTRCSYFRTLNENQPAKEPIAVKLTVLAQISAGHGQEKLTHSRDALKKMTVAAIGYALGLAERNDPDSVMRPGADDEKSLVLKPSADDIALLRHLWGTLGLQLCKSFGEGKKTDAAEKALELIPIGLPQAREAQEVLKQAREAATKSGS